MDAGWSSVDGKRTGDVRANGVSGEWKLSATQTAPRRRLCQQAEGVRRCTGKSAGPGPRYRASGVQQSGHKRYKRLGSSKRYMGVTVIGKQGLTPSTAQLQATAELGGIYPDNPDILVPHPCALSDYNNGATLTRAGTVHTHLFSHQICKLARPMGRPLCRMCFLFLHQPALNARLR